MPTERQINAMGGISPESAPPLFEYVVQQAGVAQPRVGFLPTASADSPEYIELFYEQFPTSVCVPSHLGLFGRVSDPAAFVTAQDVILVAGGNTRSMLALWREWGLDLLLRDAWEAGVVLAGFSAGAVCWFEEAVSDSWEDRLGVVAGLGFLSGSCCPHYDGEAERRPFYRAEVRAGRIGAGLAIDDHCAVHFRDAEPACVVTADPGAGAYRVGPDGGEISEAPLAAPGVALPANRSTAADK
jgi:peptidase E